MLSDESRHVIIRTLDYNGKELADVCMQYC